MKYQVCRFKPKSTFHLGTKEGWVEGTEKTIHSDTLFSAFCHNYSLLFGQDALEGFLKLYDSESPLKISSVLPYVDNEYYFPVPKNQFPDDPDMRKINLISLKNFNKVLNGKSIQRIRAEEKKTFIINEIDNKIRVYTTPRVSISSFTNSVVDDSSGYYQIGQVAYDKSVELYFLYQTNEHFSESKFKAVMNLLADEGLGGDRSVGKGCFYYPIFEEIDIAEPDNADAQVLMSLYFPQEIPIENIGSSFYDLMIRKGWIFSPYEHNKMKKTIRMFTEASVFSNDSFDGGKLVDVTPDDFHIHKVYRYGVPLTIPCQLEVADE